MRGQHTKAYPLLGLILGIFEKLRGRPKAVAPTTSIDTVQKTPNAHHGPEPETFPEYSAEATWRYNLKALEEMLSENLEEGDDITTRENAPVNMPSRLDRVAVQEKIHGLNQIPILKSVSRNFQLASRSQHASLSELGMMVRQDPGLHTKILRMVNSSLFRIESEITDVEHAMVLLGLDRIRFLAQSLGAVKELNEISAGFDLRHLWSHSFACGLLAEDLVRKLGLPDLPHAYSAGLLHDVGKIILSSLFPETYRCLLRSSHEADFDLNAMESCVFGCDHEEAGRRFAEAQKLPRPILEAMSHHSEPELASPEERDMVCILFLANDFAKRHHLGFSGNPALAADEKVLQCLGSLSSPPFSPAGGEADGQAFLNQLRASIAFSLPGIEREVDDLLRMTFGKSAPVGLLTA
ncbi:MAG: HDOD domain-containing protein [Oceanipulchritudo sp.]